MGGSTVDGRDDQFIKTVAEMIVRFTGEVFPKLEEWERQLTADPQNLDLLEQEVHQEFSRGGGLVIAGLISVVMQKREFAAAAERTRQGYSIPLSKCRDRKMSIQLLGGVIMKEEDTRDTRDTALCGDNKRRAGVAIRMI
jgi:hypothetical protein